MSYFRRIISKKLTRFLIRHPEYRPKTELSPEELEKQVYFGVLYKTIGKNDTFKELSDTPSPISKLFIEPSHIRKLFNESDIQRLKNITTTDLNNEDDEENIHHIEVTDNKKELCQITVDPHQLMKKILTEICDRGDNFGHTKNRGRSKLKILVDFSSPNIAKEFHQGHLRSTFIGNSLCNIYEAAGHEVVRINYLGDWGTQFGILLYGYEKYGDNRLLEENALEHLSNIYIQANKDLKADGNVKATVDENSKKLEQGDKEYMKLWNKFRNISITEYDKLYKSLGVKFDVYEGESMYYQGTQSVIDRLTQRGCITRDESNAVFAHMVCEKRGKIKVSLQKGDGNSVYLSRDVAGALERKKKYGFDACQYVVDSRQSDHFRNLLLLLKIIEPDQTWEKEVAFHRPFGEIKGLSTRKGNVTLLRDILNDAASEMLTSIRNNPGPHVDSSGEDEEERAANLAICSLIFHDLKKEHKKGYKWSTDFNTAMRDDNSAVSIQYCHARLCRLLELPIKLTSDVDIGYLMRCHSDPSVNILPYKLALEMASLEEEIQKSASNSQSYNICGYIKRLAAVSRKAYFYLKIDDDSKSPKEKEALFLLFYCARQTLSNSLKLIGISPLEKV